jgi:hypothetical protein
MKFLSEFRMGESMGSGFQEMTLKGEFGTWNPYFVFG